MNILVTGALGHIGSKFIHSIKRGQFDKVVLIDNLSTQRYCSLFNLPEGVNFQFFEEDILSPNLDNHFKGIDVVIHLAAITDAASSFEMRKEVERVNLCGTEKVANACVKNNAKLIFVSTTSVYGTQNGVVDESCAIKDLKPQSPYANSKLKAEQLLALLGEKDGLRYVVCRFGTIFGVSAGMRFHTAVNKFTWQACMGQPLTVWRTALNQKRPYLDLIDAVAALDFIIGREMFDNKIYNVLTCNSTVAEIVELLRTHFPNLRTKLVDKEIMNQLSYEVSSNRFVSTGFKFKGNLREGIDETIQMVRNANSMQQHRL